MKQYAVMDDVEMVAMADIKMRNFVDHALYGKPTMAPA